MPPSAQVETGSSTSHWGKDKSYAVWCWADGGNYFKSDLNATPLIDEYVCGSVWVTVYQKTAPMDL